MKVLAEASGFPYFIKKLHFVKPHYPPWAKLADRSDPLDSPWPDMVFCAEALCSVVARRLKAQSNGKTKIVCLARPSGDVRDFDLVLTTAQYRLPNLAHVVELTLPLTGPRQNLSHVTKSNLTVLVGASSPPEIFRNDIAIKMLQELKNYADKNALQLTVLTSPRTEGKVIEVFEDMVRPPDQILVWQAATENHYQRCLNEAAEIVVTSDSASMLADAVATGKSVWVYRLPRQVTLAEYFVEWLFKLAPQSYVFHKGYIEIATDRWLLVESLISKGYVQWFGNTPAASKTFDPQVEIDLAVNAVKKL